MAKGLKEKKSQQGREVDIRHHKMMLLVDNKKNVKRRKEDLSSTMKMWDK